METLDYQSAKSDSDAEGIEHYAGLSGVIGVFYSILTISFPSIFNFRPELPAILLTLCWLGAVLISVFTIWRLRRPTFGVFVDLGFLLAMFATPLAWFYFGSILNVATAFGIALK